MVPIYLVAYYIYTLPYMDNCFITMASNKIVVCVFSTFAACGDDFATGYHNSSVLGVKG